MNQPKYETVQLTISSGNTEAADKNLNLNSSERNHLVGVVVQNDVDALVSIEENGSTILPFINATWLDGKQGSFDERALELDFATQRNLTLKAKAFEAVSQDIIVEFTFKRYQ